MANRFSQIQDCLCSTNPENERRSPWQHGAGGACTAGQQQKHIGGVRIVREYGQTRFTAGGACTAATENGGIPSWPLTGAGAPTGATQFRWQA